MNLINGVITKKIEIIQETVLELTKLHDLSIEKLKKDFFLKRGIERSIQVCIEAMIDIAHRTISLNNQKPASSAGKALAALEQIGVIKDAAVYKKMIQFRNLIVHRYEIIEDSILVDIVRNHLEDFTNFINEITHYEEN